MRKIFYKFNNNLLPESLMLVFNSNSSVHSCNTRNIYIPHAVENNQYWKRPSHMYGLRHWVSLPSVINQADSVNSFISKVKKQ